MTLTFHSDDDAMYNRVARLGVEAFLPHCRTVSRFSGWATIGLFEFDLQRPSRAGSGSDGYSISRRTRRALPP